MAIGPITAIKIAYILGWTNIIGLALVLLSCRCIMGLKPSSLSKSKIYMAIYKYHCYYWWFFIVSVLAHAIFAITAVGNPFLG